MPRTEAGEPPDAWEAALRLLALRAHSELELRRKLGRKRCPPEAIDDAMRRLRERGYVDDAAYARALVAERAGARGPALIAAELASKGVGRDVADEALAAVSREEQVAAARRLASRSAGHEPERVAARLQRRGFPTDVIREALDL